MQPEIQPGLYTVQEILTHAGFDFARAEGDYRRVRVGGLGFDDLTQKIAIPPSAEEVNITLDGQGVAKVTVGGDVRN